MPSLRAEIYHNLATLLDAGIPISRALPAAASGLGRSEARFENLARELRRGKSLTEAFEAPESSFPFLDCLMVRVGEMGGDLPHCFRLLSRWHQQEWNLRRKLRSSLAFPIVVIHIAALLGPIPELINGGVSVGGFLFRALQALSIWYVVAAVAVVLYRTAGRGGTFDRFLLRVPLIGRVVLRLELSRFCRAYSSLLGAGVPVGEVAPTAVAVVRNRAVRELVEGGAGAAREGSPVSQGFAPGIPAEMRAVWQSGEVSGTLVATTERLARELGESAERGVEDIGRWLPRLVYLLVMVQMAVMILSRGAALFGS